MKTFRAQTLQLAAEIVDLCEHRAPAQIRQAIVLAGLNLPSEPRKVVGNTIERNLLARWIADYYRRYVPRGEQHRKINAIKFYRVFTGEGLRESKEAIDFHWTD